MLLDQDTIKEIAQHIATRMSDTEAWRSMIVIAVAAVAGAVGAYFGAFFKTRGEHAASASKFNSVIEQLERTTKASEGVRQEIQAQYSSKATREALYRDKLEAVMAKLFELTNWLHNLDEKARRGIPLDLSGNPIAYVAMYQAIYFPKAADSLEKLEGAMNVYVGWLFELSNNRYMPDLVPHEAHAAHMQKQFKVFGDFASALRDFRADLHHHYLDLAGV